MTFLYGFSLLGVFVFALLYLARVVFDKTLSKGERVAMFALMLFFSLVEWLLYMGYGAVVMHL